MTWSVSLCAIMRDEGLYIEEWIDFHLALGFTHITIYDNDSNDLSVDLAKRFQRVTVRPWPSCKGISPQVAAYNDFLNNSSQDWVIFLDIDEFLNLKVEDNVSDFIERYRHFDGVAINWRMFGSSSHTSYLAGKVLERFQWASLREFGPNAHVKTFFRPNKIIGGSAVHSPSFIEGARFVDVLGRPLDGSTPNLLQHDIIFDIAQINHYFTKSEGEFDEKRRRGRADMAFGSQDRFRTKEEFSLYDLNDERDVSILDLRNRITKAAFSERKSEINPYLSDPL